MQDLLMDKGAGHIKIFGGGGGVILPAEIKELMDYGITRIYSPDDGRTMGLQGMINDLVRQSDFPIPSFKIEKGQKMIQFLRDKNAIAIARLITLAENRHAEFIKIFSALLPLSSKVPVLGVTGTGGAGKSSLVDELARRFLVDFSTKTIGVISVDPSKRKTGGALLGDRIRMNAINNPRVYMRSLATRQSNLALSQHVDEAVQVLKMAGFDLIILETSGIGQSDTEIIEHSDVSLYVMTPEFGAATQLEKIDMLDFADIVAINKFDKSGALDAIRDVKKQYVRNHGLWEADQNELPIFGTIASQFNDPGMNRLYKSVMDKLVVKTGTAMNSHLEIANTNEQKIFIIPPSRTRYLSEIAENNRAYDKKAVDQADIAQRLFGIFITIQSISGADANINFNSFLNKSGVDTEGILKFDIPHDKKKLVEFLLKEFDKIKMTLDPFNWELIVNWEKMVEQYRLPVFNFKVRGKEIKIETHTKSLAHTNIPKIALPKFKAWGIFCNGFLRKTCLGNFPTLPDYILLKEQRRIRQECLQGRVDQNVPTGVFIMLA